MATWLPAAGGCGPFFLGIEGKLQSPVDLEKLGTGPWSTVNQVVMRTQAFGLLESIMLFHVASLPGCPLSG